MKWILSSFVILALCAWPVALHPPVRPAITGIASVRIAASDLESSRGFYSKNLGFGSNSGACHLIVVPCVNVGSQTIQFDRPNNDGSSNLVTQIAFTTTSADGLQIYLAANGVKTGKITPADDETDGFEATDPENHRIAFVQRRDHDSDSWSGSQVSSHLIHVGFVVHNRPAVDHFYKDILGFRPYWHGGMKDDQTDWLDLQVPDGTDRIEFMLNVPANADKHTLGVMNHIALGVPDIHAAAKQLLTNGMKLAEEPKIGRDGKWQLNLYDPDDTRVELMEFTPVEKSCCSAYTGPHPKP